jgi:hypothetical protein
MSLEMAHKVIVPQKKIMSRSFLNSGTLIVISSHIHYFGSFVPIAQQGRLSLNACLWYRLSAKNRNTICASLRRSPFTVKKAFLF